MTQIGNVVSINEVKEQLGALQDAGLIQKWELPYENLLTRISAAVFFIAPAADARVEKIWEALEAFPDFAYRPNAEKLLSDLPWRIEFNDNP
jgi:hypothetical protein